METLRLEHRAYLESLTPETLEALRYYVDEGYGEINGYLRGGENQEEEDYEMLAVQAALITTAINEAPSLPEPVIVYRGIRQNMLPPALQSNLAQLQVGDEVQFMGQSFISTSFDLAKAIYFTSGSCCAFALHLPVGTHGLYIADFFVEEDQFFNGMADEDLTGEGELLLTPGWSFRIVEPVETYMRPDTRQIVRLYHLVVLR
jgi:hypothetical protein